METQEKRLQKWKPQMVIIGTMPDSPMDTPENPVFFVHGRRLMEMIFCRNLTRNVLQKHCTMNSHNN
jgi:hypothetical protein